MPILWQVGHPFVLVHSICSNNLIFSFLLQPSLVLVLPVPKVENRSSLAVPSIYIGLRDLHAAMHVRMLNISSRAAKEAAVVITLGTSVRMI